MSAETWLERELQKALEYGYYEAAKTISLAFADYLVRKDRKRRWNRAP